MKLSRTRKLIGIAAGMISGALLALSFPPAGLALFAWVALVPLFMHLRATKGEQVVLPFFAFGVSFFTGGLFWLAPVLTPVGPFLLSFVLSVLFILPIAIAARVLLRGGYSLLLVAPLVFLVSEWLRTWLFTGFPWLLIAYSQADFLHLIQTADLFGTQGILVLIAFVNAALALAFFRFREGRRVGAFVPLVAGAAVICAAAGYGYLRLPTVEERPGPTVLLVQGNVAQYMKTEALRRGEGQPKPISRSRWIFDRYMKFTMEGLREHPEAEAVIWPETMFSYPFSDMDGPVWAGRRHAAMIAFRALSQGIEGRPAIVGALFRNKDGEAKNSVFLVDSRGTPVKRYDKVHAVPGGEYIPLAGYAPDAVVAFVAKIIEANAGFVPDLVEGEEAVLMEAAGVKFGPLVCYEIIYPGLVRDLREMGADVLLNITNYGWFPETHQPLQANQMAVFRAIEARRPVIVAANTGVSAIISATGAMKELIVSGKRLDVAGTMAVTIPLSSSGSLSAFVGEIPGILAAFATVFLVVFTLVRVRFRVR